MQRQPYPPNAASPPLHHPVPQHVSTVPMMRSPPPPQSMAGAGGAGAGAAAGGNHYGGSPYGAAGGPQGGAGAGGGQFPGAGAGFDNFMSNPTAAMGMQFGQSAAAMGAQYIEANAGKWFSAGALKHYFNVTTSYVLRKLIVVLFPWRHYPWARQQRPSANGQESGYYYLPPREDINSPDMYIPVMSFVTFILLSALLAGLRGEFHPELMGSNFGWAFGTVVLDIVILKLGTYFLSINEQSQLLDMIAYSGYKFVGIIATLLIAEIFNLGQGTGGWVGWTVFLYTFNANAFFLLRSLRYVLLPESSSSSAMARSQKSQRTYFLFGYSYIVQLFFMWVLSRQSTSTLKV